MKRWSAGLFGLFLISVLILWLVTDLLRRVTPIRVGILHSKTGPIAISEKSLIDAEVLALEELNSRGGLLGRRIDWEIADGRFRLADVCARKHAD